ncbi:MAG: asparagine synthase (glutamine-hydrolyzing), partial [Planctomycetales bacterium]|nr:asparagine synthase (glutamine-hydrolyzing) [Planctomycetales bacterium]NIM09983.1 asparagine synthase (glutamine-hydrolyzing) [Planctomycetales bacterium]NIN09421.1 asparagine synthase (glutamine-hydrolyzing) [Planctomycetales bacterium]NIN78528.1 asparagine synthase (glutamine-hydrolyzing) [Planctomycetales bacterium]NIO35721.1 asparagine synthase (glutamine-hydrolyzing) [Planctomycetales bacterium]
EIYNYRELRQRLEGNGHTFRTQCDTETLVHLYEDEGTDFVRHLVGMFAIAIWDQSRRRLILVRDRLGQKPLVYQHQPGRLLFASEIKALLQVPDVPRQVAPGAVDAYLTYQYVPQPHTIFEGIAKLPPAHLGIYQDGKFSVRCYWSPDWNQEVTLPAEQYGRQLREQLTQAVQLRMRSDVPLGAFLSGGVDSSLIVGLMQKLSARPVRTFSIGFAQPAYDESPYAREVARFLGTEHQEFHIDNQLVEGKLPELLPRLVWHFDEPFADSSAIATWYVSQQARQHVTVALTGDGGDELFAGYPRYRAIRSGAVIDRLPRMVRATAAASCWQRIPGSRRKSALRRFQRLVEPLRLPPARRYLEWIAIFNQQQRAELYADAFLDRLPETDPYDFLGRAWQQAAGRDPVTTASLADLQTYLSGDLMHKVDMASMAHSLECRQPLLDHRLVELAARMPIQLKYRRGRGKWILQQAFGDLVPPTVFRRPKMGFGVPLDHWFRNPLQDLLRDALTDRTARGRGYFRPEAVSRLIDQHTRGQRDHSDRLWALLVLELWHREWVDAAR